MSPKAMQDLRTIYKQQLSARPDTNKWKNKIRKTIFTETLKIPIYLNTTNERHAKSILEIYKPRLKEIT